MDGMMFCWREFSRGYLINTVRSVVPPVTASIYEIRGDFLVSISAPTLDLYYVSKVIDLTINNTPVAYP